MNKVLSHVRRCVEDYDMIQSGDRVAVGVSGGKDSLTLLVALAIAPEGITKDGIKQYIEDSRNQMELVELDNQEGQDEDFFG